MGDDVTATSAQLDRRLVRALREGAAALPDDLAVLNRYLGMIEVLLAEKATEVEPSWNAAVAAAAEIETLQRLEGVVAERAIAVEAESLGDIFAKLEIWRALAEGAADAAGEDAEGRSARDRLVLSVVSDVERLCRGARRRD